MVSAYDWQSDADEAHRQSVLVSYPRDDVQVCEQLDRIARLAAQVCSAPVALVSLVETDRQVFLGNFGFDQNSTPRSHSFCAHAMLGQGLMVVEDAKDDPRFRDNPLVTGEANMRFYAGAPLISVEGAPLGALCVVDTSPREGLSEDQEDALKTLAQAAMTLLERSRSEVTTRSEALASRSRISELEQKFNLLADALPQMVWSTTPDGMADYFNIQWCEYTGQPAEASFGARWMDYLHPDDKPEADQVWNSSVEAGVDYQVRYRLTRHDGIYRWMLARGLPIFNGAGQIVRWIGTCTDIHDEIESAQTLELLSQELSHRIKNIFAVIGGLMSLTIRRNPELAPLTADLQDRVLALGRAHDFARSQGSFGNLDGGQGSLQQLLRKLLSPYSSEAETRIRISGEDVPIDDRSATPLALFFHELATNSMKYGALSVPEGYVRLDLGLDGDALAISWTEVDGPAVSEPDEQGFGSMLADMSVRRQLAGQLEFDWRAEGLRVEAHIPLSGLCRAN